MEGLAGCIRDEGEGKSGGGGGIMVAGKWSTVKWKQRKRMRTKRIEKID